MTMHIRTPTTPPVSCDLADILIRRASSLAGANNGARHYVRGRAAHAMYWPNQRRRTLASRPPKRRPAAGTAARSPSFSVAESPARTRTQVYPLVRSASAYCSTRPTIRITTYAVLAESRRAAAGPELDSKSDENLGTRSRMLSHRLKLVGIPAFSRTSTNHSHCTNLGLSVILYTQKCLIECALV